MADSANTRMNNLFERGAIGLLVILLGWVQIQYQADRSEARTEIKELNVKVLELYRTSVTKQELKDFEDRLTKEWGGIREDVRGILRLYVDEGIRSRSEK